MGIKSEHILHYRTKFIAHCLYYERYALSRSHARTDTLLCQTRTDPLLCHAHYNLLTLALRSDTLLVHPPTLCDTTTHSP